MDGEVLEIETGTDEAAPLGSAQQIERINPADCLKIARARALKGARLAPQPLREQGLLQHFKRQARHESADIGHRPFTSPAQALNRRLSNPVHGRSEFGGLTW